MDHLFNRLRGLFQVNNISVAYINWFLTVILSTAVIMLSIKYATKLIGG